jgi:hypothetical protein
MCVLSLSFLRTHFYRSRTHARAAMQNPTLQSQFPGRATLNIMRTLDQSLTPLPNVSAFGAPASVYAQLLHDGVEQFFCRATSCTQALNASDTGAGGADWTCADLACSCRAGTTFCGGAALSISNVIDGLTGPLTIACAAPGAGGSATCAFKQSTLDGLFGPAGLALQDCAFGECVRQGAIDTAATNGTVGSAKDPDHLSAGVVAGLAVVGALLALVLLLLAWGLWAHRGARGGVGIEWESIEYVVPDAPRRARRREDRARPRQRARRARRDARDPRAQRYVPRSPLPPHAHARTGAGKTSLIEILAGKAKAGRVAGHVAFPGAPAGARGGPRIGFVPQQDVLPAALGVREALLFAARLRLPEHVSAAQRAARVEDVIEQLGLAHVAGSRIGSATHRGISGGEARRVSIGLELVGAPDVLVLDEPTSGLSAPLPPCPPPTDRTQASTVSPPLAWSPRSWPLRARPNARRPSSPLSTSRPRACTRPSTGWRSSRTAARSTPGRAGSRPRHTSRAPATPAPRGTTSRTGCWSSRATRLSRSSLRPARRMRTAASRRLARSGCTRTETHSRWTRSRWARARGRHTAVPPRLAPPARALLS